MRGARWLGFLGAGALALGGVACKQGQTEGSPSLPEQVDQKDRQAAPPPAAFNPGTTKPVEQVGQPAAGNQPGALAGPAAQQSTAAGGSPGAEIVVDGHLVEASAHELLIDAPNQHSLRVKIDGQTRFSVDGKSASAKNLIEGAEVRAAYKLKDGEPVGTRIDGTSNLGKLHPAEMMAKP